MEPKKKDSTPKPSESKGWEVPGKRVAYSHWKVKIFTCEGSNARRELELYSEVPERIRRVGHGKGKQLKSRRAGLSVSDRF
ncbi:uncharacterized protein G2W53_016871 [Senna tora]|uniref:Uncharacterized protein n=1 Tax=Senna tora TaxID=362788 RepID=A0A834TPX5_9FABA|nr:uncharacterized protein G2W53_016871 [Senna tora]